MYNAYNFLDNVIKTIVEMIVESREVKFKTVSSFSKIVMSNCT